MSSSSSLRVVEDYVSVTPEVSVYHAHLAPAESPPLSGSGSIAAPEATASYPQMHHTEPSPLVQLSYLPHVNCLHPWMSLAYPVMLPIPFQTALSNGQPLGVVLAALDDPGNTCSPPAHLPTGFLEEPRGFKTHCHSQVIEERAPPHYRQETFTRTQGRRDRRRRALEGHVRADSEAARPLELQSRSLDASRNCDGLRASHIFTEAGCKQALAQIERRSESLEELARSVHSKLSDCLTNAFANSVVVALLTRAPYGRKARRNSVFEAILVELKEALPRSAMHPLGREVYLTLMGRVMEEGDLPSQTSKSLIEKIAHNVGVMINCSQARTVLRKALQISSCRSVILASIQDNVDAICKTSHGCEFVSGVLRKFEVAQLAMAILESPHCFRHLSRDLKWSSLLVQASGFGHLHRSELAERIRSSSPQDQMKLSMNVKRAALWT